MTWFCELGSGYTGSPEAETRAGILKEELMLRALLETTPSRSYLVHTTRSGCTASFPQDMAPARSRELGVEAGESTPGLPLASCVT